MKLLKTNSKNKDFLNLIRLLDESLRITDGEDFGFYNQFNNLELIKNVIVAYKNHKPIGCGAFKRFDENTVEIKRMFVVPDYRSQGIAGSILTELESWARSSGFTKCVLETGINQIEALGFYKKAGYLIIPNYEQYKGLNTSVCFKKVLTPQK